MNDQTRYGGESFSNQETHEVREARDSSGLEVFDAVSVELILELDTFVVVDLQREEEVEYSESSGENNDICLDFATVLGVNLVALRVSDDIVGDEFHVVRVKSLVVTRIKHSSLQDRMRVSSSFTISR